MLAERLLGREDRAAVGGAQPEHFEEVAAHELGEDALALARLP